MTVGLFLQSLSILLFELVLTRVFAIVLFASFAHLAIALALLGIGIGATALHLWPRIMPAERLRVRMGHLALLQAVLMLVAVGIALALPFTPLAAESAQLAASFKARIDKAVRGGFVSVPYLALLLPFIAAPFVCGGIGFAAAFRHRREAIGRLYAADLCGGAVGCLLFLPLIGGLGGPDAVLPAAAATALAAAAYYWPTGLLKRKAALACGLLLLGVSALAVRYDLFHIRYPAGFDERRITYQRWTPLARLAVWEWRKGGTQDILIDNTSRAELALSRKRSLKRYDGGPRGSFSIVYKFKPPGRVMIIGAGGGFEVHVAQAHGHRDITAVELSGGIFDIMRERFGHVPDNPYLDGSVRTVAEDGRSFARRERALYDIIEMRQPNIFSYGGLLADAWNARLLVTREAFGDYLARLKPDGVVVYDSRAGTAKSTLSAAVGALRDRGVRKPQRHIVALGRRYYSIMVKPTPFTADELSRLRTLAQDHGYTVVLAPDQRPAKTWKGALSRKHPLTDDRPFWSPPSLRSLLGYWSTGTHASGEKMLWTLLWFQVGVLFLAGLAFTGLPLLVRGRRQVAGIPGVAWALAYSACLGYAYLAVEIVLVYKLVLFLGHPTYAVTLVLFVLLVSSGAGSVYANRVAADRLNRLLLWAIFLVILCGLLFGLVFAPVAANHLLRLSAPLRIALTGLALFPLGFVMGMPFPAAMRGLPEPAAEVLPWCWAINGWMSVVAATASVILARYQGYSAAYLIAMGFYALALILAPRMRRIGIPAVSAQTRLATAGE